MSVTVYTTSSCPYCYQVKEYLSKRSVPFREQDVSRDAAAAAEMVRVSGQQGVPVTVFDDQVIIGFDRRRLDEAIARAQRPRLGAAVADASAMAAQGRTNVGMGAYVGRVTSGDAAQRAGLQVGDVIVELAGRKVDTALALERLVSGIRSGSTIPVAVMRGDERVEMTLIF